MQSRIPQVDRPDSACGPEPLSVAERAHELWVSCGGPVVQDDAVWRAAERELLTEQQPNYGSALRHPPRSR